MTHYQFAHFVDVDKRDYKDVTKKAVETWNAVSDRYAAKYYPQVSVGRDSSPRAKQFIGSVIKNNTPENFEKALLAAKTFVDAHPDQARLITINSWNEWTERSYLQPFSMYEYGCLKAVKNVFLK